MDVQIHLKLIFIFIFFKNDTSVVFVFCKINPFCIYNSLFIKQGKDTKLFFFSFFFLNITLVYLLSLGCAYLVV